MKSLADFLHMGGYASYVWGSYAVALIVLVTNVWLPVFRRRQIERLIRRKIEHGES